MCNSLVCNRENERLTGNSAYTSDAPGGYMVHTCIKVFRLTYGKRYVSSPPPAVLVKAT